jgi:hypothetical protein
MRLLAASLAALFALCGSAGVAAGQDVQDEEFIEPEIEITGEITAENLGDYFRVWNLDTAGFYDVELDVSNLALALLSDDLSQVLDYRLNEFPKVLEDVVPNQEGEIFLAVCATDGDIDWTLAECETGSTENDYILTVTDAPEPGAIALDLAALLCLGALSRARLRSRV